APVGNELAFDSDPAGGKYVYDLEPLTVGKDAVRVFDVTDPYGPTEVLQSEFTRVASGWRMRFNRVESGRHRYRVLPDSVGVSRIVKPPNTDVFDAPGSSANLRKGLSADYLVIYYDPFEAAAESLRVWRQQRLPIVGNPGPYQAERIPISAIYDQFSG